MAKPSASVARNDLVHSDIIDRDAEHHMGAVRGRARRTQQLRPDIDREQELTTQRKTTRIRGVAAIMPPVKIRGGRYASRCRPMRQGRLGADALPKSSATRSR